MIIIYAGGHISRAHYNPAVTAAMYMRGKVTVNELPGYCIAQLLGGTVAAFVFRLVNKADEEPESIPEVQILKTLDKEQHSL